MLRTCALIFAVQLWLAPAVLAQTYAARIEDLPLMPGLVEQDGAGLVFDKPEGRIVEAVASGTGTPQAVADYYAKVLPQLGWQRRTDGSYTRENERLAIAARTDGPRVTVQFTLSPN